MELKFHFIRTALLLTAFVARGQGFTYDQQSSVDETAWPYGAGAPIQLLSPYGQSFTPNLTSVNFIRLNLNDNNPGNALGATLYLNLRADSISGAVLATTPTVSLPSGFTGPVDFFFQSEVPLTPLSTYTFEIVVQLGSDSWNSRAGELNYAGGMVFANGLAAPGSDVWFREGTYTVPEPSTAAIMLLGAGALWWHRRRRRTG